MSSVHITFWQFVEGHWKEFLVEPDIEVKGAWYRRYKSPIYSSNILWRLYEADGCDNPGTKSRRVEYDELPADLRLTLTLLGKSE